MKRQTTSILLIVLILSLTSACASPSTFKWSECVAVLPGARDDIGGLLANLQVPHRTLTRAELTDDAFLDKLCVLYLASGSAPGRDAIPHITRWIQRGGSLYGAGDTLAWLAQAFPDHITQNQAVSRADRLELTDAGAKIALPGTHVLQPPAEGWPPLAVGRRGATVHASARTLAASSPLIVSWKLGQGTVVYNALTFGTDTSDAQQKLIRMFALRALFAPETAQLLERLPNAYAEPVQIAGTMERATVEFDYSQPPGQDWDAALLWNGGKRGITLSGPSPTITRTQQNDRSPLIASVRGGAGGEWKMQVSAPEAANAHSPFLLMVIPRRGTQLGNSVPTPLQISTRAGVVAGNLGLMAVTAALLFLGASLFADVYERQRQDNRVLRLAAGAANKTIQVLGVAFAPMEWKTAPTVRRVALVLELTILLALTALVAAFLDPHFAPGEARGVGLFFGLLIALSLVTVSSALGAWLAARATGAAGVFRMRPGYVVLAAVCVIVSRVVGFVPGFLFGLPAAWAMAAMTDGHEPSHAQTPLTSTVVVALAALAAPLGLGALCWVLTIPTDLILRGLAHSSIPAALAGGLASLVNAGQTLLLLIVMLAVWQTLFESLPIGGLRGWALFSRLRWVWLVVFAVAAFTAFHLLLNPNLTLIGLAQNRAVTVVIIFVALYSAAAMGIWLLFNAGKLRGEGAAPQRSTLISLGLTILIWLCLCGLGIGLSAWSYLGSR